MALINLELKNLSKYKCIIVNIYKFTVIFLVFTVLIKLSFNNKTVNLGFNGKTLINNNIINTLCILLLSYLIYELIFKEIIHIS